eukprot:scaffold1724_cov341-Pavlova_lutheri.AAC.52
MGVLAPAPAPILLSFDRGQGLLTCCLRGPPTTSNLHVHEGCPVGCQAVHPSGTASCLSCPPCLSTRFQVSRRRGRHQPTLETSRGRSSNDRDLTDPFRSGIGPKRGGLGAWSVRGRAPSSSAHALRPRILLSSAGPSSPLLPDHRGPRAVPGRGVRQIPPRTPLAVPPFLDGHRSSLGRHDPHVWDSFRIDPSAKPTRLRVHTPREALRTTPATMARPSTRAWSVLALVLVLVALLAGPARARLLLDEDTIAEKVYAVEDATATETQEFSAEEKAFNSEEKSREASEAAEEAVKATEKAVDSAEHGTPKEAMDAANDAVYKAEEAVMLSAEASQAATEAATDAAAGAFESVEEAVEHSENSENPTDAEKSASLSEEAASEAEEAAFAAEDAAMSAKEAANAAQRGDKEGVLEAAAEAEEAAVEAQELSQDAAEAAAEAAEEADVAAEQASMDKEDAIEAIVSGKESNEDEN